MFTTQSNTQYKAITSIFHHSKKPQLHKLTNNKIGSSELNHRLHYKNNQIIAIFYY